MQAEAGVGVVGVEVCQPGIEAADLGFGEVVLEAEGSWKGLFGTQGVGLGVGTGLAAGGAAGAEVGVVRAVRLALIAGDALPGPMVRGVATGLAAGLAHAALGPVAEMKTVVCPAGEDWRTAPTCSPLLG